MVGTDVKMPKSILAYFHSLPPSRYSVKATSAIVVNSTISVYHKDFLPLPFLLSPTITEKYFGMETTVYFTTDEGKLSSEEVFLGSCQVRIVWKKIGCQVQVISYEPTLTLHTDICDRDDEEGGQFIHLLPNPKHTTMKQMMQKFKEL